MTNNPFVATKLNPRTRRKEYAVMSMDGRKVLQYVGKILPSDDVVQAVRSRVDHYVNQKKKDGPV